MEKKPWSGRFERASSTTQNVTFEALAKGIINNLESRTFRDENAIVQNRSEAEKSIAQLLSSTFQQLFADEAQVQGYLNSCAKEFMEDIATSISRGTGTEQSFANLIESGVIRHFEYRARLAEKANRPIQSGDFPTFSEKGHTVPQWAYLPGSEYLTREKNYYEDQRKRDEQAKSVFSQPDYQHIPEKELPTFAAFEAKRPLAELYSKGNYKLRGEIESRINEGIYGLLSKNFISGSEQTRLISPLATLEKSYIRGFPA